MEPETHSPIAEPTITARAPMRTSSIGALAMVLVVAAVSFGFFQFSAVPVPEKAQTAAAAIAPSPFDGIQLISKAAVVIDIQTGKTLYEHNADAQLPLASLTKVAMALAVAEVLPTDDVITIPYNTLWSSNADPLRKGDRWRVRDVLDYTLIASSNEGADILAAAADDRLHARFPQSPADGATLWRMNDLAQSLGLSGTYFLNVNGLDISTTQSGAYGSARDVAKLFAYAASAQPSLFAGTAEDGELLTSVNGKNTTLPTNTNESRGRISGLIMGKTGLTDLAGGNLAVVYDVGLAHPVVAVVLGSTKDGRFDDIQKLVAASRLSIAQQ